MMLEFSSVTSRSASSSSFDVGARLVQSINNRVETQQQLQQQQQQPWQKKEWFEKMLYLHYTIEINKTNMLDWQYSHRCQKKKPVYRKMCLQVNGTLQVLFSNDTCKI